MGEMIVSFGDGTYLEYDYGKFDEWCVYYTDLKGKRKPPLDTDYFERMKFWYQKYGKVIYDDYVEVYDQTGKTVDKKNFVQIKQLSKKYDSEEQLEIVKVFSILYMAMISEENKKNTRLGRRIKRLGIYKLLIEDYSPHDAAWFMKGMKWYEIAPLCEERGF